MKGSGEYDSYFELFKLMRKEGGGERVEERKPEEEAEKKPEKEKKKTGKKDRSVRRVTMSRGTALVSVPPEVRERAELGKGVYVRVRWDEGLEAIVVKVIKAAA